MMYKRIFSSSLLLIMVASVSFAQAPSYALVAQSGTYTAITGGTNAILTYNAAANYDDGISTPANAIPIGFTFNYNGTNYTTIRACANGFAAFGSTALANNTDVWTNSLTSAVNAQRPILAPLWDDMNMGAVGAVTYQLSGSSPNQVLTIQWANAVWQYSGISPAISFQIKLYETTNVIEFHYRQEAGAISNAGDLGASIGITTTGTGANSFLSLSDAGTNPQVSSTVETSSISTKPASGQIYRWIPYCAASATNTSGEKIANFTYNTINNNSSSTAGYVNLTNVSTISYLIPTTSSLPFSTTVSSFSSTDQVVIFIDFNHNGDFNDPGETVFTSTLPLASGTVTGTINIPAISAAMLVGRTRLRIRLHDTNNGPNATSCGTSTAGQVQDYTVDIQSCAAAAITTQPVNTSICNGSNGFITTATTGTNVTYQWQVSTNGGGSFSNISNGALYNGVTTNTLNITGATTGMNGNQYRVLLNGSCTVANTPSGVATLTVNVPGAITQNPTVTTYVCVGSTAKFIAAASGSTPSYQWQVSTDGGINYSDISAANAATYSIPGAMALNGNRYRCVASIAACGSVVSTASILVVNPLPVVTISAVPYTEIKPTMTTTITVGSVPTGASYAWTLNGATLPGANSNAVVVDADGVGTYRATVTDVNGCSNTSENIKIGSLASPELFIYPNPSNGPFHVRLYSPVLTDWRVVSIYNAAGVLVANKEFPINFVTNQYQDMQFDFTAMPKGLYFVKLAHRLQKDWVVTGKIIIQ